MQYRKMSFIKNLMIFAISYPIAIIVADLVGISMELISSHILGVSSIFSDNPDYYHYIQQIIFLSLFIMALPMAISFTILKIFNLRELKLYLVANIIIALVLIEPLTILIVNPNAFLTAYGTLHGLMKATIIPLVFFSPSLFAGTFVFHRIERRIVRGNG
jgi:hypothetical protein